MHDDCVFFGQPHPLAGKPIKIVVLASGGEEGLVLSLVLHAKHHHHIRRLQHLFDVACDPGPQLIVVPGYQCGGAAHPYLGPHFMEENRVRARNPAVCDIPYERHFEALDTSFDLPHRECVEQCLCGMLMHAVPGIDDRRPAFPAQQVGGARGGMANNDDIGRHRLEVSRRVQKGFPLRDAAGRSGKIEDVRAQPFLREFEGRTRARGRLEKQVDYGLTAEGRNFLDRPVGYLPQCVGSVQDQLNFLDRELGYSKQIFLTERRHDTSTKRLRPSDQNYPLLTIFFVQPDFDNFVVGRLDIFPNIVSLDRQLTMAAVDHDGQLHALGAPEIDKAIQRGADCATGVEDVVDKNEADVVYIKFYGRLPQHGPVGYRGQIIAVKRDIQYPVQHGPLENGFEFLAQARGKMNSATPDAYDGKLITRTQFLDDLRRNPGQRQVHLGSIHQKLSFDFFGHGIGSRDLSWGRQKRADNSTRKKALQTASSLLYFQRMLDKKVRVKETKELGAANYLLTLGAAEQARLVQPGQFVMVKCAEEIGGLPLLRRPFSVFNVHPNPRTGRPAGLDLLVKDVGTGSHKLAALRPGQEIHVLGPQGRPFQTQPNMGNRVGAACLVAGGVGIAALYMLASRLLALKVMPYLFYGGRSEADLVLRENFERLGVQVFYTTEDGSLGERGIVTTALACFLKSRPRTKVCIYSCGPWAMMKAVHDLAVQHRVPCQVSLEARMGCSLGACMGCVIRGWDVKGEQQYLRVCLDGPIMESRAVDWETPPF